MKKQKLYDRVRVRVERRKDRAFVMRDFSDIAVDYDYDQVLRVLRRLIADGRLVKIGRGIYAKTRLFSNGKVMICASLKDLACEALEKLGVKTGDCQSVKDYNSGMTTQLPTGRMIAVGKRVRRSISYNGYFIGFERMKSHV